MALTIKLANLDDPTFIALVDTHMQLMHDISPPDSIHALPLDALRATDVTVWELRDRQDLLGCGALKQLSPAHGEIKTMHTLSRKRGEGLGRIMLEHILGEARTRGYARLSLETGPEAGFLAARRLYETYGFTLCGPFSDYSEDPHSTFMTLEL